MFRFKQFSIAQDQCAMKVSTDGIVFGSWCKPGNSQRILDIGTGTGLLSLMLAQKTSPDVAITAVEIDKAAAMQARQNIEASPWSHKIRVVNSSIQDFAAQQLSSNNEEAFHLIVSNPPWFDYAPTASHNKCNQIRESSRTKARQQVDLTLSDLLHLCQSLLGQDGELCLILPASAESALLELVENRQLVLREKCQVLASAEHDPHCQMWRFAKGSGFVTKGNTRLVIRDKHHAYTKEFVQLCKDYYLKF